MAKVIKADEPLPPDNILPMRRPTVDMQDGPA